MKILESTPDVKAEGGCVQVIVHGLRNNQKVKRQLALIFCCYDFELHDVILVLQRIADKLSQKLKKWKCVPEKQFDANDHYVKRIDKLCYEFNRMCDFTISFESPKRCLSAYEIVMGNQKKIFSRAIHGVAHHTLDLRFQMLSIMFADLRIGPRDLFSVTPEKNFLKVKETCPPDQREKIMPTSSNLVFVALGWSGNAPTITIEAYHPKANKWFYIPQHAYVRRAYHGVVMMGIFIYIIGGFDGRLCHSTTFCFDVQNRRWSIKPSMMVARCYVTALAFRGIIYAMGGYDGDERFRSCERFDPLIRQWRYFSSMNVRRSDASGAVHNGKVYVCGGFDGVQVQKSAEIYDPDQDQWTLVSDMLGPRSGQVLVSYQEALLVIGGFDGEIRLRTVERFDEEKNTWVEHIPLHSARSNFAAAVLDDHLYVIGGYNGRNLLLF
ncbi:kelch-like protein 10 [Nephila pilipes]|uniref:Kelch-like protein 10 n=1 Tax=Nephila pilipes TaxID=299642 RepID=A0A8X6NML0_NEPPI|nr:kelch-like protein 10 [Nephila pilipes]